MAELNRLIILATLHSTDLKERPQSTICTSTGADHKLMFYKNSDI